MLSRRTQSNKWCRAVCEPLWLVVKDLFKPDGKRSFANLQQSPFYLEVRARDRTKNGERDTSVSEMYTLAGNVMSVIRAFETDFEIGGKIRFLL